MTDALPQQVRGTTLRHILFVACRFAMADVQSSARNAVPQAIQVLARLADQQHAFGFSIREGFDINRGGVAVAEVDLLADGGGDL